MITANGRAVADFPQGNEMQRAQEDHPRQTIRSGMRRQGQPAAQQADWSIQLIRRLLFAGTAALGLTGRIFILLVVLVLFEILVHVLVFILVIVL